MIAKLLERVPTQYSVGTKVFVLGDPWENGALRWIEGAVAKAPTEASPNLNIACGDLRSDPVAYFSALLLLPEELDELRSSAISRRRYYCDTVASYPEMSRSKLEFLLDEPLVYDPKAPRMANR